ncbi:MAG: transcription termination/antitermination NusG family protein [Opitutaceae bacterium]|jgi:transcription elongation factor/antiterminator RfaH
MNWYCVHTRPQKEAKVCAHLAQTFGLETYFPRLRRQRTIRRVKRIVTGPLFPRYLFCRFDYGQRCRAVKFAPDVLGVVSFGDVPAVVDESLIDGLKAWAGEMVDVITVTPALQTGDRVQITDGPMRGLEAIIENDMNGRERVAVILSILERDVQMTISRWQLTKVI